MYAAVSRSSSRISSPAETLPMLRGAWAARLAILLVGLAGASGAARADTIYSTMGPNNNSWVTNSAYLIVAGMSSNIQVSFVASASASLTQIGVGLDNYADANPAPVTISLYSSSSGKPGTVMGSWSYGSAAKGGSLLAVVNGISNIDLVGGTTYWLGVSDPNSWSGWGYANSGTGKQQAYINRDAYTIDAAAFYLVGTRTPAGSPSSVPEPGSITILGAGLLGLTGFVRSRRKSRL